MKCASRVSICGAPAVLLCASMVSACVGSTKAAAPATDQQPAVLVAPSSETREELARAVAEGMNGAPVRLADDALTGDSELIITRAEHRDPAGRLIEGRSREKPEHFSLIEQGGRCILVQERTGRRWVLHSAMCSPAATR
jgi:hypothetical protein